MTFLDDEHEKYFFDFLELDKTDSSDTERHALFYILSGLEETRRDIQSIYDFTQQGILRSCLQPTRADEARAGYASSTRSLLELAFNLYNNYRSEEHQAEQQRTTLETFSNLDENRAELALNAIRIRFSLND